ncbi:membrane protein [Mycolicibacterium anyangense]|uniref:Membrane protein n=1 Tax=Mycolicibacterium anyangense TaxID=1431246 RepID=A0A6N4W7L8_9MYCO|nr:membrane protein [Mycolicibacterium anyangense]
MGFVPAWIIAKEVTMGVRSIPTWLPYTVLGLVAVGALLWLSRTEVRVVADGPDVELWAGQAHLPVSVVTRSAEIPRTAKSAALGRQLDPAAFVLHRGWVGPLVLLVLDDPDDPTPYWLVSARHPDKVLSALRS